MKIAIMGGTFNPVHIGHLFLAEEVKICFGYEKILFIPSCKPAHKTISVNILPKQRLEMLKIALSSYPDFIYESCEIKRKGVSYTIDTIKYILQKYKITGKPGFIIGDDLIENYYSWKDAVNLAKIVNLIVAHRKYNERKSFNFTHTYIDNLILHISSSDIRKRIKNSKAVRFLLCDKVMNYIVDNKLYK